MKVVALGLGVVLMASVVANIYLVSRNNSLSAENESLSARLDTMSRLDIILSYGTLTRNGTIFEEAALQPEMTMPNGTIVSISNGTTVIFQDVGFTYIAKNWNCSCTINLFKVEYIGWTEMLQISPPSTPLQNGLKQVSEVYTHHTNPTAGLAMNDYSTLVFLLVSPQPPPSWLAPLNP